jgi:AraC-like DNA-binding protein
MLSGMEEEELKIFRSVGYGQGDQLGIGVLNKNTPKDRRSGPERFPFFAVCIVIRGNGSYEDCSTGKSFPIGPGNFFLRIPGVEHVIKINIESRWREYFMNLGFHSYPYFKAYFGVSAENPVGTVEIDHTWKKRFMKLAIDFENCLEHRLLDMIPGFFSLASECFRKMPENGRIGKMVNAACVYLSSNYCEKKDIHEFCRENGWGYEDFRKRFRELTGMSPNKYRTRRRMDAARALLMQKNTAITEISTFLGYCSPHEFSAKFKNHTGITPSAFRQTC